jgi:hypothetical protein
LPDRVASICCYFAAVRIGGIRPDHVSFDSGLRLEAPLLVGLPLGVLALVSLWAGGFDGERSLGTIALFALAAIAVAFGLSRTNVVLCPSLRRLQVGRASRELDSDPVLLLSPAHGQPPNVYEVSLTDLQGKRHVLIQSDVARVLNDLARLREVCPMPVLVSEESDRSLEQIISPQPTSGLRLSSLGGRLSSPRFERQPGMVGVLLAISLLALVVVVFLVTGQLSRAGPVGVLGIVLGFALIATPSLLGLHIAMSKTELQRDGDIVSVTRKRGLLGSRVTTMAANEIRGGWLVCSETTADLVLLQRQRYLSIPIAGRALAGWRSRLGLGEK